MSVKLVDVGEHLSPRETSLRFISELWWLHNLPHISLTQYFPISCSDPLTNVRDNVYIKSLSWMLKPMSLLYCLLQTTLPAADNTAQKDNSCSSTHVPWAVVAQLSLWALSLQATDMQITFLSSFLCECHGRTEGMSPWEVVSQSSPELQHHL